MQTQQWKFREIVIEAHPGPPTFGGVTLIALRAQFADVNIAGAVATGAVLRQLLRGHAGRVARMTIDLYVTTREFPVSVPVVVEVRRLPFLVTVTLAAVVAEASGMRVLPLVAADAFARQLVFQVSRAVTVLAVDGRVRALEPESRLFLVIELRGLPSRCGMAVAAFRATLTAVYIVRCVARHALTRCVLVMIPEVTGGARHADVFVAQWESGFVVIVGRMTPGGGVMAGIALTPEFALVGLVLLVAVHALGLRAAIRFSRHVAARACDRCVRPMQREVGALVIELLATEFDDVARASQMLRMTGVTLRRFDALEPAVEAMLIGNVSRNVLVTIEAKPGLAMAIATVVAVLAVLFILLMRDTQLSGHEQCLRVDGFTAPHGRQT